MVPSTLYVEEGKVKIKKKPRRVGGYMWNPGGNYPGCVFCEHYWNNGPRRKSGRMAV